MVLPLELEVASGARDWQENSGNDPNTQLVPSSAGARGSWKQAEPEPPAPDARASALTAGSNWAGPGKAPGLPFWQPPEGPYPTAPSLPPRDRQLNPHEYPTLSAAAVPRPQTSRQPVPTVPLPSGQVHFQRSCRRHHEHQYFVRCHVALARQYS